MSLYTNFDHTFNEETVKEAKETGEEYQHSAWNFCGYVSYDKNSDTWTEVVWRYNRPVETLTNKDLKKLIEKVNDKYGHD